MSPKISRSDALVAAYPTLAFGCVTAVGIDLELFDEFTGREATETATRLRDAIDDGVAARLASFSAFFATQGHHFPLSSQLKAAGKKGFPPVPTQVLSLLVAECATGVLMGVQDAGRIEGDLVVDVISEAESFEGMRERIECKAGEIVVRDTQSIIASYFQGPDRRTAVTPRSTDLVYYVFSTPEMPECAEAGVSWLMDMLACCCDDPQAVIVPRTIS